MVIVRGEGSNYVYMPVVMDVAFKGQSSNFLHKKKRIFLTNPFALSFCWEFFLVFKSSYVQVFFDVYDLLFGCTTSHNVFQIRSKTFYPCSHFKSPLPPLYMATS